MMRLTATTRKRILNSIPRIWWGFLVCLHIPILAGVGSSFISEGVSIGRLGSAMGLLLAIVFFALKLVDCRYLRLRTRRQSLVAACLLTAIVHGGAVAPTIDESNRLPVASILVTSVALGLGARTLRALSQRVLRGFELFLALLRTSVQPLTLGMSADIDLDRPMRTLAAAIRRIPRAPPA